MHRELSVPVDTTYLLHVRQAVLEILREDLFPQAKANMVALAVDEAVANIMEHAYGDDPETKARGRIEVVLDANPKRFEVLIRDDGVGFDPREAPGVDIKEHVKAGRKGGLGIFLMRQIMDEVNYTFKHGIQNELQMIKYVDGRGSATTNNGAG